MATIYLGVLKGHIGNPSDVNYSGTTLISTDDVVLAYDPSSVREMDVVQALELFREAVLARGLDTNPPSTGNIPPNV